MVVDLEKAAISVPIISMRLLLKKKKKGKNRLELLTPRLTKRKARGIYNNLVIELWLEDKEKYEKFLRLDSFTFDELLNLIRSHMEK